MASSTTPSSNANTATTSRRRRRKSIDLPTPVDLNGIASNEGKKNGSDKQSALLMNDRNKYRSFITRLESSIVMIVGFSLTVYLGHVFIWLLIIGIQILMAKELFTLSSRAQRQRNPHPPFRLLNWYFFFAAAVYVYGSFMRKQLTISFTSDQSYSSLRQLASNFIKYHLIISYSIYIAGFVAFILKLKKGQYHWQFSQYAWTHMIIFVVFFQSSFFVANIFQGIIWFLLPCSLIIINDCAAYVFGFFFGKTPLIKLSPKKTWEGFIGGSIATIMAAFMLAGFMGQFDWLICPRKDLSLGPLHCQKSPMFQMKMYSIPPSIQYIFPWEHVKVMPIQLHALAFGIFASSIAPFGGFFASGLKRAFKIKDFGDSIPGHGGITDRMDCQMVMSVFAYIYFQSFIAKKNVNVESILSKVMVMDSEQLTELYVRLGNLLISHGLNLTNLHTSDPQSWAVDS